METLASRRSRRVPMRAVSWLVMGAVLSGTIACTGDDDTTGVASTTSRPAIESITAVTAVAPGVRVDVPAGEMDGPGVITIDVVDPPSEELSDLPGAVVPLGPAVDVSLEGASLTGTATLTFELPTDFDLALATPVVLWESGDGGYEAVPTALGPGDGEVTATVSHFSRGLLARFDPRRVVDGFVDWVGSLVTGRAGASNPTCGDEAAPRSAGITVSSDGGDLVKWCYGRDAGRDVLTVTNNWSAGVQVSFPKSWTVVSYQGAGVSLQALADWADSRVSETSTTRSRLVGAGRSIVVEPTATAPGTAQSVVVEQSLASWAWSAALTGVDLLLLVSRALLKLTSAEYSAARAFVDSADLTKCFTDQFGTTMDPFAPLAALDLAGTIRKVVPFALKCGEEALRLAVEGRSPPSKFLAVAAIGTISTGLGIAYGLVNSAFAGIRAIVDQVASLFDDGEIGGYGYDISLAALAAPPPTSPPTTAEPPSLRDCEGVNMGVVADTGYYVGIVESTCSAPWALVSFTEADPSLSVVLVRYDGSGNSDVVDYWQDLQLGDNGSYTPEGIAANGVPLEIATAMFAELGGADAGNSEGYQPEPTDDVLANGDEGDPVRALQGMLRAVGILAEEPDGHFGPATEQAVREFQSRADGLDADGKAGPETMHALDVAAGGQGFATMDEAANAVVAHLNSGVGLPPTGWLALDLAPGTSFPDATWNVELPASIDPPQLNLTLNGEGGVYTVEVLNFTQRDDAYWYAGIDQLYAH